MVDLIERHKCLQPIDNNHDRQKLWSLAANEYNDMFGTKLTRTTFRTKLVNMSSSMTIVNLYQDFSGVITEVKHLSECLGCCFIDILILLALTFPYF